MSKLRRHENGKEKAMMLAQSVIADATMENIQKAKKFINGLAVDHGNVAVCCARITL
jgi:hypothetical protein